MKINITFIGACLVAADNGQASLAERGNQLTITNSPNAIINWSSFSVAHV